MRVGLAAVLLLLLAPQLGQAQTHYYNLDAGRPTRVEDAIPTERYGLDLHFVALRVERLDDGTYRWRAEPKLSFGALPMTSVEIRAPLSHVVRPRRAQGTTALAGIGVGALHALNVERRLLPALAVSGEVLAPVGGFSSGRASYAVQGLVTKTLPVARLHVNASLGTYAVRPPRVVPAPGPACPPGFAPAPGGGCEEFVLPPDVCALAPLDARDVIPSVGSGLARSAAGSAARCAAPLQQIAQRPYGLRWSAGLGIDRTLPLKATLVSATIVADQFRGLYPTVDWTAEIGVRRQWSPRAVLDVGVGRRFTGSVHSTSVTLGMTYSFAARPPRAERSPQRSRIADPSATGPFEQTYLLARHNWTFRNRYADADRLLNAFDYGHAILYETLLRQAKLTDAAARLDGPVYDYVVNNVLRHPPDLPLEERSVGVRYATLVPELVAIFEWAHVLHRQLYDVMADERLTPAQREQRAREVVRYYQSRPDLALSSAPKSMDLMEGQAYSLAFRRAAPKFNGLIWSYHWLQIAVYEALLLAVTPAQRAANIDTSLAQFWAMVDGAPGRLPTVMPMSPAVAPQFSARYPDAAIIFDNLHALHDVAADIIASPTIPRTRKRAALLAAAAAYRDSTTAVTSRDEWRQHSVHMGVEQMGGRAPVAGSGG
jgi:hypothetical protein